MRNKTLLFLLIILLSGGVRATIARGTYNSLTDVETNLDDREETGDHEGVHSRLRILGLIAFVSILFFIWSLIDIPVFSRFPRFFHAMILLFRGLPHIYIYGLESTTVLIVYVLFIFKMNLEYFHILHRPGFLDAKVDSWRGAEEVFWAALLLAIL